MTRPRLSHQLRAAVTAALLLLLGGEGLLGRSDQPAQPFRILVTNDDGVRAPGLGALADALAPLGEVIVIAPMENHSGTGHAITLSDPIYVEQLTLNGGRPATGLAATPASCVRLALARLLPAPPHLVVSGVNPGFNYGRNAYISGTVAAAREAAFHGIPAIAASVDIRVRGEFGPAAAITARIASAVKDGGLPPGVFLNVNVPAGPAEAIRGLRVVGQSRAMGTERFDEARTPYGRRIFWSFFQQPMAAEPDSDVQAVLDGYAAVTPLAAFEGDDAALEALRERIGARVQ